jgi:hypothetical protein
MKFEVRNPYRSNHRTEGQARRTAIEPAQAKMSLKALSNKVLSGSSYSNQLSNSLRTEQFEQGERCTPKVELKSNTGLRPDPTDPCPVCGSGQWWQLPGEPWHCRACEPDMPLTATTLTLCHAIKEKRPLPALTLA